MEERFCVTKFNRKGNFEIAVNENFPMSDILSSNIVSLH